LFKESNLKNENFDCSNFGDLAFLLVYLQQDLAAAFFPASKDVLEQRLVHVFIPSPPANLCAREPSVFLRKRKKRK
jgi:hypothetical protein